MFVCLFDISGLFSCSPGWYGNDKLQTHGLFFQTVLENAAGRYHHSATEHTSSNTWDEAVLRRACPHAGEHQVSLVWGSRLELQRRGSDTLLPLCPFIFSRLVILAPTDSLEGPEHFRITAASSLCPTRCPLCWEPGCVGITFAGDS